MKGKNGSYFYKTIVILILNTYIFIKWYVMVHKSHPYIPICDPYNVCLSIHKFGNVFRYIVYIIFVDLKMYHWWRCEPKTYVLIQKNHENPHNVIVFIHRLFSRRFHWKLCQQASNVTFIRISLIMNEHYNYIFIFDIYLLIDLVFCCFKQTLMRWPRWSQNNCL